ncbi:LPS export ABC transporter ATP-binding protein [Wohlfahrtiimonas chitiniclastica]|uniref:LPS export ABC transporter ATP-binding protein n=1 Tax=Wohlfahrtiimonas chitiniclastica TaxID=400946 RepID=UPI000B997CC6|nr:LPS export ABC transporter ATP-binding protein [Wohlfahrtiimonas chitiniclastica]OYQ74996.1 LPS export ABC transporter ATP-binding protein [Wohlfahrtiimonas chitiniclastica]
MQLRAKELVKRFKKRTVVNGASFHVDSGEIVGLLGPNGAGKTTSFYMTVGLIVADEGHVFLGAHDITKLPMHERAHRGIGYLPQEASIFRKMTSRDNILAICQTRKDLTKKEQHELADQLLEDFKVTHIANSLGMSLSGGERRRVEIARSLALNPKFLLLDEPFAGVDPLSVADIQTIILELSARGIGVLITDHNIRETLSICQRSYILSGGQVIAEGSTAELLDNQIVRTAYLGDNFSL